LQSTALTSDWVDPKWLLAESTQSRSLVDVVNSRTPCVRRACCIDNESNRRRPTSSAVWSDVHRNGCGWPASTGDYRSQRSFTLQALRCRTQHAAVCRSIPHRCIRWHTIARRKTTRSIPQHHALMCGRAVLCRALSCIFCNRTSAYAAMRYITAYCGVLRPAPQRDATLPVWTNLQRSTVLL